MTENKRSPLVAELIKGLIFLGFGVILIVQPWLRAVSWLGWLIVVVSATIAGAMLLRIRNAARMRKNVIAEFESGDAVYERGLKIGGMLYDFSTFGAEIGGATYEDGELRFYYSYYAKKRGRASETVILRVGDGEEEKARAVIEHLGLPNAEHAQAEEEKRRAALEGEKKKAALERKDR